MRFSINIPNFGDFADANTVTTVAIAAEQAGWDRDGTPFEVVLGGASPGDAAKARDVIAPLADAGATWWDERNPQTGDDFFRLEPILRRIEQGPPTL